MRVKINIIIVDKRNSVENKGSSSSKFEKSLIKNQIKDALNKKSIEFESKSERREDDSSSGGGKSNDKSKYIEKSFQKVSLMIKNANEDSNRNNKGDNKNQYDFDIINEKMEDLQINVNKRQSKTLNSDVVLRKVSDSSANELVIERNLYGQEININRDKRNSKDKRDRKYDNDYKYAKEDIVNIDNKVNRENKVNRDYAKKSESILNKRHISKTVKLAFTPFSINKYISPNKETVNKPNNKNSSLNLKNINESKKSLELFKDEIQKKLALKQITKKDLKLISGKSVLEIKQDIENNNNPLLKAIFLAEEHIESKPNLENELKPSSTIFDERLNFVKLKNVFDSCDENEDSEVEEEAEDTPYLYEFNIVFKRYWNYIVFLVIILSVLIHPIYLAYGISDSNNFNKYDDLWIFIIIDIILQVDIIFNYFNKYD